MWWERAVGMGLSYVVNSNQKPKRQEKIIASLETECGGLNKNDHIFGIYVWITWTPDGEIILGGLVAGGVSFKISKAHTLPRLHSFSLGLYLMLINQNSSSQWLPQCHACLFSCSPSWWSQTWTLWNNDSQIKCFFQPWCFVKAIKK